MSHSSKGKFCDQLISWLLIIFLLVYPFFLHPAVYLKALGLRTGNIDQLDFFYEPRANFLFFFICGLLLIWSLRFYFDGSWEHKDRGMDIFLFALLFSTLISTIFSLEPLTFFGEERRREGFFTLFSYYSLFLLAQNFLKGAKWRFRATAVIVASATIVAIYGIFQTLSIDFLPRDFIRASWTSPFATIGNPIFFGSYLLLVAPLPMALFTKGRTSKIIGIALSLLFFAAIFMSWSRGAWLGLFVLLILFFFLQPDRWLKTILTLSTILILIILAVAISVSGTSFLDRFLSAFSSGPENSLNQRLYIWRMSLPLILEKPFFGWGPDAFGLAFPQNATQESLHLFGGYVYVDKAHCDLLQVAVTLGLVGLAAYLAFLVRLFSLGFGGRKKDPLIPFLLPGLLGYIVSLQLSFSVVSVAPLFWVLAGMSLEDPNSESSSLLYLNSDYGQA